MSGGLQGALGAAKNEIRGRVRPKKRLSTVFERFGSARFSRPGLDLSAYLPTDPGFYVEAGAYDGYTESNTYYLERFKGWTGVLVEAIPALYAECVKRRPRSYVVNCALVSSEFPDDEVAMQFGGVMSVVKDYRPSPKLGLQPQATLSRWSLGGLLLGQRPYEVRVPARTLTSVLDEAGGRVPDLLSLDVEGYEPEVLGGLDLDRYRARVVVVECLEMRSTLASLDALLERSYDRVGKFERDFVYVRRA